MQAAEVFEEMLFRIRRDATFLEGMAFGQASEKGTGKQIEKVCAIRAHIKEIENMLSQEGYIDGDNQD